VAAYEITRELICCPYDDQCGEQICKWGHAARAIVLEVASGERDGRRLVKA